MSERMMRWIMLALAACGGVAACGGGGDDVPDATVFDGAPAGRQCLSGVSDPGAPTSYNQPDLQCPVDRICLHVEGTMPDLCTTRCQDDMGCAKVVESPCATFTCIAPFDVGAHACEKMCVCSAYVPDGGFGTFCPM